MRAAFLFGALRLGYLWTEKKNYAGSENHSPHLSRKRSHFDHEYRKAPPPQKREKKSMGIKRVAGLA